MPALLFMLLLLFLFLLCKLIGIRNKSVWSSTLSNLVPNWINHLSWNSSTFSLLISHLHSIFLMVLLSPRHQSPNQYSWWNKYEWRLLGSYPRPVSLKFSTLLLQRPDIESLEMSEIHGVTWRVPSLQLSSVSVKIIQANQLA